MPESSVGNVASAKSRGSRPMRGTTSTPAHWAFEVGDANSETPQGRSTTVGSRPSTLGRARASVKVMDPGKHSYLMFCCGGVFLAFIVGTAIWYASSWSQEFRALKVKVAALTEERELDCTEQCSFDGLQGRWQSSPFGHTCWNEESKMATCECTSSKERPEGCADPSSPSMALETTIATDAGSGVLARALRSSSALISDASAATFGALSTTNASALSPEAVGALALNAELGEGMRMTPLARRPRASSMEQVLLGTDPSEDKPITTPRDTVNAFCDRDGLRDMHGQEAPDKIGGADAARDLETKILGDVARELETNNVDKMAKEIFSFYICARWAPDETFWQLAEQEMAAQIVDSTIDAGETPGQAIAELYQTYKFVPMLCSSNFEVFRERDPSDNTYFRKFKNDVNSMADWIVNNKDGQVSNRLKEIDQVFCGDRPMNDCKGQLDWEEMKKKLFGWCPSWLCGQAQTRADLWKELEKFFKSFKLSGRDDDESKSWDGDFRNWKEKFPYHSFIAKPEGWKAVSSSPKANERFVICFGKRIASEMHRRPSGQHILTDQNNIGCHGWWSADAAGDMLRRTLALWKPPTCQLATMTYKMKKEIMAKFQEMNERLFDSLPSMINDELLEENSGKPFDLDASLPQPYNRQSKIVNSQKYVDKMRVRAIKDFCAIQEPCDGLICDPCVLKIRGTGKNPDYGVIQISDGEMRIVWDKDKTRHVNVGTDKIQIVPKGWTAKKGLGGHVKDIVAGVGSITDKAREMFDAMFNEKYSNLADMMSGSVSKWAVCPIRADVDVAKVDAHLGVEDAAFQDFQKEGYRKWTGFKEKIPGEECVSPSEFAVDDEAFAKAKACDINELMANHVEAYTEDGQTDPDPFVCPIRPPLPPHEQLAILGEKTGTCFLKMNEEQERQYVWHYQGLFPARRQYTMKENAPKPEYELIKLLKSSGTGLDDPNAYGRFCSLEELLARPRFCKLAPVQNTWPTIEEFAQSLSDGLTGSLGVGASAVAASIGAVQAVLRKNASQEAKEKVLALGETTWEKLTGAGRLLRSSSYWLKDKLKGELPGDKRLSGELEDRLFGETGKGQLLHQLSYQHGTGTNGRSSNAKDRYKRYVVTYPCPDFDPAYDFGIRKKWSRVALQMIAEAYKVRKDAVLTKAPDLHLWLRGEGLRFRKQHEHREEDTTYYVPMAAMQWIDPDSEQGHEADRPNCQRDGVGPWATCEPANLCETTIFGCKVRPWWSSAGWWSVSDSKLIGTVAPFLSTGNIKQDELYGLELSLHCGPKEKFGAEVGGETPTSSGSLKRCLEKGVESNARLHAEHPWKLYFPDEVVVLASFKPIEDRRCLPVGDAAQAEELCRGAVLDNTLTAHIPDPASKGQGSYEGIHSGAGYPKGTLQEVHLRPEDVLEALGLIAPSAQHSWP
eukprot:TRINITY_DN4812_c0_g2_i1.p1 TRINITY_DN4812_c0_g2~~TRINITY_DN4812_c0_g2_i1.p1  ORF type:complete len:1412 (+),score=340.01 TRINITY_DN4812_c0_g2_i1:67-4302(+)